MNLAYLEHDEFFPVIIPGKRLTSIEAESLIECAGIIIRENPSKIAVNLENVEAIDSSGISFLVKIAKSARSENIELILYGMNESLNRLFYAAGLDSFFTISTTAEFKEIYEL
jgi:anti-anti-sigma factor